MQEPASLYRDFFKQLPISEGDFVYISSDLRKLIYQAKKQKASFDAQAFLSALKELVGPQGTIIIPAFNYNLADRSAFDIRHTQPITGMLSVEALKDPSFRRTRNPMHSFAVWGRWQPDLLALENRSSFGADSPFHFMQQHGCKLLGIDVDLQQSLTFAHYAEDMARVSYRKQKAYRVNYTDEQGQRSEKTFTIYAKKPGYVNQVNPLLQAFRQAGIIREFAMGQAPCFVLDLPASFDIMVKDLKDNKARNMTYFSWPVYFKSIIKSVLGR